MKLKVLLISQPQSAQANVKMDFPCLINVESNSESQKAFCTGVAPAQHGGLRIGTSISFASEAVEVL